MASSNNDANLTSIIDFNLSDIKFVGITTVNIDGDIVSDYNKDYEKNNPTTILTFEDFIDWVQKYDTNTQYMGWNALWYDIPHIKYELVKRNMVLPLNANLLNCKKYQQYPVYDLKEHLFSHGYSSSMLLTLEGLNIPYKFFDYKKLFEANDEQLYIEYLTEYVNNIK